MRRISILLLVFMFSFTIANAQKMKTYKKQATKALTLANDASTADEAKSMLDAAIKGAESATDGKPGDLAKLLLMKGQLYGNLVGKDAEAVSLKALKGEQPLINAAAGMVAFKTLGKALEANPKSADKKAIISTLVDLASSLNITAVERYNLKDFAASYEDFALLLKAKNLLSSLGNNSVLGDPAEFNKQKFFTGVVAMQADKKEEGIKLFEELYSDGYKEPLIYESLYKAKVNDDEDAAMKILDEGMKAFPEEKALRYAQINYFIKKGKFDELEAQLQAAIEQDPENSSLYLTLGNTYDNLYQKADKSGDRAKKKTYFDKAMNYYKQALEKDEKNFNAMYAMGAMYYNSAVAKTKAAADITYSKATASQIDGLISESNDLFKKAKPHFDKAYSVNAKDRNTLIALKEIAVRMEDYNLSKKYKAELDALK